MARPDILISAFHASAAQELRHVRTLLEQLAGTLAGDDYVATHYMQQLQSFDLAIQCTDELVTVLDRIAQGTKVRDAIAEVRLATVQDRLRSALADVTEAA